VNSEDDIQELDMEESDIEMERITALTDPSGPSVEELQNQLENAINQEDYEKASKIRDEIKRRGEGNESRS
jgi:protein-arginine kinase activator protein McsA